jgi:hypothetical protein
MSMSLNMNYEVQNIGTMLTKLVCSLKTPHLPKKKKKNYVKVIIDYLQDCAGQILSFREKGTHIRK